jgi:phosphoribosylanthranilate isomerase
MTKVKICGIRSLQDARWAIQAGAWAVGFIFAPSPRRLNLEQAASIIRKLPPSVHKVGVFVDSDIEGVRETIRATGIDMLQFHGAESPEYCQEWDLPVIKSFRVRDEISLAGVEKYKVFAHLFDTFVPGSPGGSGRSFDWRYLHNLPPELRIIVAGGLNPENVTAALRQTQPFAVDVSSGVEIDGRKGRHLIEDFIRNVHTADASDNLIVS